MRRPRLIREPDDFTPQEWGPWGWTLLGIAAGVLGAAGGAAIALFWNPGPLSGYEYRLWRWEVSTTLDTALGHVPLEGGRTAERQREALSNYFRLTSEIRRESQSATPNQSKIESLTSERAKYENDVEYLIEDYIEDAVDEAGLKRGLPLFDKVRVVWPPVAFELASPPRLLVRSPRNEIKRDGDTLLRNDLSLTDIERIEAQTDDADTVSIVVAIGGLAAYPAIVRDDRSYDALIDTASHEWVHHYLAFFPLGEQWGKGGDAETLNETTASIAGREIAAITRLRHPVTLPEGADGRGPAPVTPTVDFDTEMHALRLQVDALLAAGDVAGAEAAMEEKRQYLNANGFAIRKINQAYFAFFGTYADTSASTNPIGPKIELVWDLTRNVGVFLRVMREVTDGASLDRTIAVLQGREP